MPVKGAWRRFNRVSGADIGKMAKAVYVCDHCGLWHETKPTQCASCGFLAFTRFDSKKEATKWAALLLQERGGIITDLRRQVRYPLLTVDERTGKPVQFAVYVADFVFRVVESGETIILDVKGGAISPEASLKLRVMQASGRTVTLE